MQQQLELMVLSSMFYSAISFGGTSANADTGTGDMLISLVADKKGMIPGIYVDLTKGALKDNAGFLESQIYNDLKGTAFIDRKATSAASAALKTTELMWTKEHLAKALVVVSLMVNL